MSTALVYECVDCGAPHEAPSARCRKCGHMLSVNARVSHARNFARHAQADDPKSVVQHAENVTPKRIDHIPTGIARIDALLGGGLVAPSISVISADPGAGKSRFTRQAAANAARRAGRRAMIVSAEETNDQVRANLDLLGLPAHLFDIAYCGDLALFEAEITRRKPSFFVFDSLQYLDDSREEGGGETRRMNAFKKLRDILLRQNITGLVVSHVNGDGDIAEDKVFERLPDAYFYLGQPQGRTSNVRSFEVRKSRYFGPGQCLLTMTARGLQ